MSEGSGHHRLRSRPRLFYGWRIVAVGFLGDFAALGMGAAALAVFLRPMSEALGWNFTQISAAVAVQGALSMALGPLVGPLLDRYGARPVMVFGAVTAGLGLMIMSQVQEIWQFYVLYAIIGALGLQEAGRTTTSVAISKWFVRRLNRALAIASAGSPAGAMVIAPLIAVLIGTLGWREAWFILGVVLLVMLLPPTVLWVRRSPEDMGLYPDGEPPDRGATSQASSVDPLADGWTVGAAIRTRTMWLLISGTNLASLVETTLIFHLINYLQDLDFSRATASLIYSLNFAGSMLSRVIYAFALEHFAVRNCLTVNVLVRAFGLMSLVLLPRPAGIPLFLLSHGVFGGSFGVLTSYAWAKYYGRRFIGSIRGINRLFMISSLVGPVFAGSVRDITGSYEDVFTLLVGLSLLGAFLLFHAKAPVLDGVRAE